MFTFSGTSLTILTKQGTGQGNSYMCCGQQHITVTCIMVFMFYFGIKYLCHIGAEGSFEEK